MNNGPTCALTLEEFRCLHCQSVVQARGGSSFCCAGCETVYGLLQSSGLGGFYSILEKLGARAQPAPEVSETGVSPWAWLDLPENRALYESGFASGSSEERRVRFYLEGVHCAACVWLVEKLPRLVSGVQSVALDLGTGVATVHLSSACLLSLVAEGFLKLGYVPHAIRQSDAEELERREDRQLLTRLGVAAAAAGNIMLLSIALYAGADGSFATVFSWVSFALSLPVLFYSAVPFYRSTWDGLRAGALSIDVPIALGIQISFWSSAIQLFRGSDQIYFDSITALVFLLLATRCWLRRVQRRSLKASSLAEFLIPTRARRKDSSGRFIDVKVESLAQGDVIEVLPGDILPCDGVVLSGMSALNLAVLTGESIPQSVQAGAQVYGGTQNLSGRLTLKVKELKSSSRVGKILESVESSLSARAPILGFSDRVARVFILSVLCLLPIVFLSALNQGIEEGLQRAIAVALVTCPCVFALATPLTFAAALRRASRAGVLIKGSAVLERLSQVRQVYLDKTGTLTEGKFEVLGLTLITPSETQPLSLKREDLGPLILALEAHSRHPIAKALVSYFSKDVSQSESIHLQDWKETPGKGVSAIWMDRFYCLGSSLNPSNDPGVTEVSLFENGHEVARLRLGDPIRQEAAHAVAELKNLGLQVAILSGDDGSNVQAVARKVGVSESAALGSLSPEEKETVIKSRSHVLMVGDGLNDAAALASASVGVSMRGGLEVSIRASDVYFSKSGLHCLPDLILLGRETITVVKRNFIVSLIYNGVAIFAAISGQVTPLLAALLMPLSAALVLTSAQAGTSAMRRIFS